MAISNEFDSTLRSRQLLKDTIAFIGMHNLQASPVNYAVAYEYLLGDHLQLKQQVDQALSAKQILTNQLMDEWFKKYLYGYVEEKLKQSQTELVDILFKLNKSATQTEAHVIHFDEALRFSEEKLNSTESSIDSVIAHLLKKTGEMQSSIILMKQQIQESRQEIHSLQERLERATEEALIDPLSGLTNRKGLIKAIEAAVSSGEETKSYPCLLMMDIDYFKRINDSFGHLLGDRVIKLVGQTLKDQIKGKDTAARYGGEEFCVLLTETELSDAVKVAEKIRYSIEKARISRLSDNQEICRMTVSVGVARFNPNKSITSLFEQADKALYMSKDGGRNRVTCLDD